MNFNFEAMQKIDNSLSKIELYIMLSEMIDKSIIYKGSNLRKWIKIFIERFQSIYGKILFSPPAIDEIALTNALADDKIEIIYLQLKALYPDLKGYHLFLCYFLQKFAISKQLNLDFRNLNLSEWQQLKETTQLSDVISFFAKVAKPYQMPLIEISNPWLKWNSGSFRYNKMVLLTYNNGVVTVNGGVIDIQKLNQKAYINVNDIDFYLLPNISKPDNIVINNDKIPLLRLDRDVLTGLDFNQLIKFKECLQQSNTLLLEAPDHEAKILADCQPVDKKLFQQALTRLRSTRVNINKYAQQIIGKVRPVPHPKLFITIGGSGSGKGLLKDLALSLCDNNLVEASLDKARYYCDAYKLLVAANHHADDYKIVTQYANALRDKVLNLALESNLNLFFDGSGIPYTGRYSKLIEIFKHSGYEIYVLVADSPFVLPLNKNYSSLPAYQRIINRFNDKNDHRTLPWHIAIEKHILQPKAQFDAAMDANVGHYYIIDSIMPREKSYVMAETLDIDIKLYELLQQYKNDEKLTYNLLNKYTIIDCSTKNFPIKYLSDPSISILFLQRLSASQVRILLIFNQERFIQSMEKCVMNPQAKGLEDIYCNTLPFLP